MPPTMHAVRALLFAHRRVPATLAARLPLRASSSRPLSLLSSFFKAPKGFGRSAEAAESEANAGASASSAATGAASAAGGTATGPREATGPGKRGNKKGSGGGGSSGGDGGDGEIDPWAVAVAMSLMGGAGYWYFSGGTLSSAGEISWQEFRNTYLATGMVDRLEVVNKDLVRVSLRSTPNPMFARGGGNGGDDAGGMGGGGVGGGLGGTVSEGEHSVELLAALAQARHVTARGNTLGAPPVPSLYFKIGSVESFERQLEDAQLDMGVKPRDFVLVRHVTETTAVRFAEILAYVAAFALYIGFVRMMSGAMGGGMGMGMGGGGGKGGGGGNAKDAMSRMFSIGKVKPPVTPKEGAVITFKDVAGCDEAKAEIQEFVQFLKDPARFTALGAKIPKGALLVGPPGTGKTLLAKATAGEAGVPFFSMSGSDFIEMFVGVGPSRVRDLFSQAREKAPSIIFIDEIDAVARARGKGGFGGGNDERENTLNQLLVEMDGFTSSEGVLVLAGTNRVDILDKAILRPGRFDRRITVDKPDIKGRFELFQLHMRNLKLAPETVATFSQRLAALTPGFVGADVANICNEAAIHAARGAGATVGMKDFEAAIDRVVGGFERRNSLMTPEERRTVAFHEAGHAVAGWFLEHADPLLKVTIIPRSNGALGFAQYLPKEVTLFTQAALQDRMCMALGGRVAEELTFGRVTTGASDDLDKVTQIAYAMTTVYGMSSKVGHVSFPRSDDTQFSKPYSEALARVIDEEVRLLVDACYERTRTLLATHAEIVKRVAELLLERETINQGDLVRIAGERPAGWTSSAVKDYLWTQPAAGVTAEGAGGAAAEVKDAPTPTPTPA